jgi:serine/threonine protein kinase
MTGAPPPTGDNISASLSDRIDQVCDRFEQAVQAGQSPRIEDFIADFLESGRAALLAELIALEMDLALNRGQPVRFEEYLQRFPEFADGLERCRSGIEPAHSQVIVEGSLVDTSVETVAMSAASGVRQLKHFRLMSIIGQGAFGTVWRAIDTRLQREVAVKIPRGDRFPSQEISFFLREARAAAKLRHPNIVSIYEIGEGDGASSSFIVTDYVDGPNLKKWLETHPVGPHQAAALVSKIARALDHAHSNGIVHRDLKPANILMDSAGEPHLADFGLAKRETGDDSLAVEGRLVGTPIYMAPEQARGDHSAIDRRTDIYSLGVILYELLAGQPPFRGELSWLMEQISHATPKSPRTVKPTVPDDLEKICLKCLAKDKGARYQTAADLADDLQRYLNGESLRGVPVPLPRRMRKWFWRNRRVVMSLSATAVLCAGLVGGLWWWNTPVTPKRLVLFETEPLGCEITVVKLDRATGDPDPTQIQHGRGKTPLRMRLEPGDYLVVAVLDDVRFHEVMRHVPMENESGVLGFRSHYWRVDDRGCIRFWSIDIPSPGVIADMGFVEGSQSWRPPADSATDQDRTPWIVPAYFIDRVDLRAKETRSVGEFRGTSSYYSALRYAEEVGKRLPSNYELLYVQSIVNAYREQGHTDDPIDRLPDGKPILGISSEPWEWTTTKARVSDVTSNTDDAPLFAVRCGAPPVVRIRDGTTEQVFPSKVARAKDSLPDLGVRCVRSPQPRRRQKDFLQPARLH